jgi:cytochrome b561
VVNYIKRFWSYLGETQPSKTRILHLAIACLIVFQIIISNFMGVHYTPQPVLNAATWVHIAAGLLTTLLCFIFIIISLKRRGFAYFFPYVYGDFTQLIYDIKSLRHLKLPDARPGSLPAIVQGLGLGALLIVTLSGCLWFISWLNLWACAPDIQSWHKTLTGLIEFYIVGHGALGVLHFILRSFRH